MSAIQAIFREPPADSGLLTTNPLTWINPLIQQRTILMNMNMNINILDQNTLSRLSACLLARKSELLGEISSARQADIAAANAIGAAATDIHDTKDLASNSELTLLKDAEERRDQNELADVNAALSRLNGGNYGVCVDCAQPIDLLRLTAIPAAARCLACQTQFESPTS
jgi:DnaK suppressor protein